MRIGKWQLDVKERTLTAGSQTNRLTPRAWDTLVYLARRAGEVVTKEELLERFWRGDLSEDTAVRKSILEIRRALEDDPSNPTYIKTVTRQGYALVADVVEDTSDAANAIAVLPFDNLTGDAANDHLGDGLAEELINKLAHRGNVAVVARNSSFKFKGQQRAIPEIGEALKAAFVIEGSIRRHEGRIRTTVQLIDARNGLHLFSRNFDHDLAGEIQYYDAVASAAGDAVLGALRERGYEQGAPAQELPPTQTTAAPVRTAVRRPRWVWRFVIAGLAVMAVVVGVQMRNGGYSAGDPPPRSIAVLPFTDLAADSSGFHADLIHYLSEIGELTVIPRDVARNYSLEQSAPREIGRALNTAYLLSGMAQISDASASVSVQLIDAREGSLAWSEQYRADGLDIGGAMDRISAQIASQLAVTLNEAAQGRLNEVATHSWEAYELLQQALAHNDHRLWNWFVADHEAVQLLRRSLAADPDYLDAKFWLTVGLVSLPDGLDDADEMMALAAEILQQKPDDPWVNRTAALVIGRVEGDTPEALARREALLRHAVANRGELHGFLVDLALFLWFTDLSRDALQVMREWQKYYPDVISPMLAQLELSFNHDAELAAHYAEVVLANGWGAAHHVAPYHLLRNDYVESVRLLSLPDDQYVGGRPAESRDLLAAVLAQFYPDAALAWLDWAEANGGVADFRQALRSTILMRQGRVDALAAVVEAQVANNDPEHLLAQSNLSVLQARLADDEDERLRLLDQAFRFSEGFWSQRRSGETYNLRAFQMGSKAIGFAIMAAYFDPEASRAMLGAIFNHYDAGAAHWNIADKYMVLTLAHALAGDVDAAVEQFALAEKWGFRALYNLEVYGVFDERNTAIFHGLHADRRFLSLVEQIRQRNRQTLAAIKTQMPHVLEPGCYEPNAVQRRAACSVVTDPTLSSR